MSIVAEYILKNNETNRVLFVIDAKAEIIIGLRTNGVINVSLAKQEYLFVAVLFYGEFQTTLYDLVQDHIFIEYYQKRFFQ